jgi:hypothetical protein
MVHDELPAHQLGTLDRSGLDLMAGRAALELDERLETVTAIRGGSQAQPATCRSVLHARLERHGGDVMALVHHDQAVGVEHRGIVPAREALDHGDVDHARRPVAAAADLADVGGVDIEVLGQPGTPLVDQLLAVDDDQRRQLVVGDDRARHDRLARTGRRDEHSEVVAGEIGHCVLLLGAQ